MNHPGPTHVMHGDDDQIVPIGDFALLSVKLLRKGTLKVSASRREGSARLCDGRRSPGESTFRHVIPQRKEDHHEPGFESELSGKRTPGC